MDTASSTNVDQLVDAALNHPEWEFIQASIQIMKLGIKTKQIVLNELRECAEALNINIDEADLEKAYDQVKEDVELLG